MKSLRVLFLICFTFTTFGILNAQSSGFEIQNMIERLNEEVPAEKGCEFREYILEDCEFSVVLRCKGNEIVMSFDLNDIERVYKDRADIDDTFDTLFFVCNNGNNCIASDSDLIPASPIFPIRLPEYQHSTLGEDAIAVFSTIIGQCE